MVGQDEVINRSLSEDFPLVPVRRGDDGVQELTDLLRLRGRRIGFFKNRGESC
jgi:hypothetical protein